MGANASGKTITFSYNEDGSRASKTVNGTRTDYIYNGSKVMRETSGGVAIDFIYDADGRPFAMKRNGAYYYYILNLQGDVIRLVNSSGATVASYEYDPYGKVISATGSMAAINPLRYRSYYYDSESGMYFLQSRYYDPAICRFINADDYASTGQGIIGHNMFAYCRNQPITRMDISGTADFSVTDGDDDNPFDDLAAITGGGGYSYGVSFATSMYSSLYTGGFYQTGYSFYEVYYNPAAASSSTAPATPSACFVAGTLVQGENGAVPIEDISAGDMVWAWDEATCNVALKAVVETYINETSELIHVFVNGEEIITTPAHPFYTPVKGWTEAAKLWAGDILVTVNGEYVVVEKVQHEILEDPIAVYNFQVEGYHTYFVTACCILVHNACSKTIYYDQAKELGYSKVNGRFSHGQAIFFNSKAAKGLRYISPDVDSHNGGWWKGASSIEGLSSRYTRSGTYNRDLSERIGD